MKKLLLMAAVAVLGFTSVNAQTEKGNWMFGGSSTISFTSNQATQELGNVSEYENKTSTFSLSTGANYFVIDNFAVGIEFSFINTKYTYESYDFETEIKTKSFRILPQITYFFKSDNFAPFVGAKVGYLGTGGEEDGSKDRGVAFGGTAGLAYFISSNVSIDLAVEYLHTSLTNKENDEVNLKNSTFGVGIGFSVYL